MASLILLLVADAAVGATALWLLRGRTGGLHTVARTALLAATASLFFGVGILASGGEPGFAFPMPIAVAAAWGVYAWIPETGFLMGVVLPFFFWTVVYGLILVAYRCFRPGRAERPSA